MYQILNSIKPNIINKTSISEEVIQQIEDLSYGRTSLNGSINQDFSVSIKNGYGKYTSPSQTTFWVTIQGSGQIISPDDDSTWNIIVRDTIANKIVLQNPSAKANQPIAFKYKTGFKTQLQVEAIWSKQEDTTLKVHINARY